MIPIFSQPFCVERVLSAGEGRRAFYGQAPLGLEGSGAFWCGRDRDRNGAFQYSRRLTRPDGREG